MPIYLMEIKKQNKSMPLNVSLIKHESVCCTSLSQSYFWITDNVCPGFRGSVQIINSGELLYPPNNYIFYHEYYLNKSQFKGVIYGEYGRGVTHTSQAVTMFDRLQKRRDIWLCPEGKQYVSCSSILDNFLELLLFNSPVACKYFTGLIDWLLGRRF